MEKADYIVKLLVIGDSQTGKTSLIARYLTGSFGGQIDDSFKWSCHHKNLTIENTNY